MGFDERAWAWARASVHIYGCGWVGTHARVSGYAYGCGWVLSAHVGGDCTHVRVGLRACVGTWVYARAWVRVIRVCGRVNASHDCVSGWLRARVMGEWVLRARTVRILRNACIECMNARIEHARDTHAHAQHARTRTNHARSPPALPAPPVGPPRTPHAHHTHAACGTHACTQCMHGAGTHTGRTHARMHNTAGLNRMGALTGWMG